MVSFQMIDELRQINRRLSDIKKILSKNNEIKIEIKDYDLLKLKDHLRKTYMVVLDKKECSANDVSLITGRCRAMESNYLNQLSCLGKLKKYRKSKVVLFKVV